MSTLKKFKDLGISAPVAALEGDKIGIDRILNRVIVVHSFRVEPSKFPEKGYTTCLYLQIAIGEIKYVVFTSSKILQNMISGVAADDFPFEATIERKNGRLEFS